MSLSLQATNKRKQRIFLAYLPKPNFQLDYIRFLQSILKLTLICQKYVLNIRQFFNCACKQTMKSVQQPSFVIDYFNSTFSAYLTKKLQSLYLSQEPQLESKLSSLISLEKQFVSLYSKSIGKQKILNEMNKATEQILKKMQLQPDQQWLDGHLLKNVLFLKLYTIRIKCILLYKPNQILDSAQQLDKILWNYRFYCQFQQYEEPQSYIQILVQFFQQDIMDSAIFRQLFEKMLTEQGYDPKEFTKKIKFTGSKAQRFLKQQNGQNGQEIGDPKKPKFSKKPQFSKQHIKSQKQFQEEQKSPTKNIFQGTNSKIKYKRIKKTSRTLSLSHPLKYLTKNSLKQHYIYSEQISDF